jgi:hypothetical protein
MCNSVSAAHFSHIVSNPGLVQHVHYWRAYQGTLSALLHDVSRRTPPKLSHFNVCP